MYDSFYHLSEKPFQINTDPGFLWLGEKHREALANLKYGLVDHNGIVVLTGDIGTGKTTLVNALLDSLDDKVCVAKINHTRLEPNEFLSLTARTFDPGCVVADKCELLLFFNDFLNRKHADGNTVLLIVDEAHRLSVEILEEIRLLTNIEQAGKSLLSVIFVGQQELVPILLAPQCRALRQRITLFYDIQALTVEETALYVQHRLRVSGAEGPLFSPNAIAKIHAYTKGNPRMINILCDRALLTGYVKEAHLVDAAMITECAREIDLLRKRGTSVLRTALDRVRSRGTSLLRWTTALRDTIKPGARTAIDFFGNRFAQWHSKGTMLAKAILHRTGQSVTRSRRNTVMGLSAGAITFVFAAWTIHAFNGAEYQKPGSALNQAKTAVDGPAPPFGTQAPTPAARQRDIPAMDAAESAAPSSTPEVRTDGTASGENPLTDRVAALAPEVYPPVQGTLQERVDTALAAGNFKKVIELVEANANGAPQVRENFAVRYARALMGRAGEVMQKSPEEAEQLLRKAIEAAPSQTQAPLMLGAQYIRTHAFNRAIGVYDQVLKLDPEIAAAWFNLGFSYTQTADFPAAERAFERAAGLKPPYLGKCLFNLAVVQQKLGKNLKSMENLKAAADIGTDNGRALAYLNRLKKAAVDTGQERMP
jgi:type II secretory pathway predicted ATPase ExeA/tetratricopeptide (TPR) repeat protein